MVERTRHSLRFPHGRRLRWWYRGVDEPLRVDIHRVARETIAMTTPPLEVQSAGVRRPTTGQTQIQRLVLMLVMVCSLVSVPLAAARSAGSTQAIFNPPPGMNAGGIAVGNASPVAEYVVQLRAGVTTTFET